MRLKDKVTIITGGSRGIGYATADKFLKEGATVILTASSQGSADKAVAQLKEKYPDATVAGISPNLSNLESVRNAFREAARVLGWKAERGLEEMCEDTWRWQSQNPNGYNE